MSTLRRDWQAWLCLIAFSFCVWMLAVHSLAHAFPPAGSDPNSPVAAWYRSLEQPGTGIGCCSIADCRPLADSDWRQTKEGYEVKWKDDWLIVPQDIIIRNKENPTGQPVACIFGVPSKVQCFVIPPEA